MQAIERGVLVETRSYLQADESARIVTRPLAGLSGPIVQMRDLRWLVLSVSLLKCSVQAELGQDEIAYQDKQYNVQAVDHRKLHAS